MVIRSYSTMESQVQSLQNPSQEEHSSTVVGYGDERLPKRLQIDELSSYKIETQLSQNVASAILTVGPIKNSDGSAPILSAHQIVTSLHDQSGAKREALIQAIHKDPKDYHAYHSLANCLEDSERVELLSGESYTKQELDIKSRGPHPQDPGSYCTLAKCLSNNEMAQLRGKSYTKKELYIQTIHIDPKDYDSYRRLANCLEDNERAELLDGKSYTKRGLYIKAIHIEPKDHHSYYNLANCLEDSERVQLLSGKSYTKKELYITAIYIEPRDHDSYYNLANCLEDSERVVLLSGESYTKQELYIQCIDLDPQDFGSYYYLARCLENNKMVQLLSGAYYTKKTLYIKVIDLVPKDRHSYIDLADYLENNETVQLLNGESYTKKALYIKAIDLEPKDDSPYIGLADCLENHETVQLLNGESYPKKAFYIKAIDLEPRDDAPYIGLADCLENKETVQLLSGAYYTKKALYIKAIDLEPRGDYSYVQLANCLESKEMVQLLSGAYYTKKALYIKAIDLEPRGDYSYAQLANCLENKETVQFLSGEIYTKQALYIKAIDLEPKCYGHYYNLAQCMVHFRYRTVQLLDGESYTERALYIKAIDLEPAHAGLYRRLAELLNAVDQTVQLLSGEICTRKTLYIKAIDLEPTHVDLYSSLTFLLKNDETVQLLNGEIYTKKTLYIKALDLKPNGASLYRELIKLLSDDERVQFLNGEVYTKKQLYIKLMGLDSHTEYAYYKCAKFLKEGETVQLVNGEPCTKKELFFKATMGIRGVNRKKLREMYTKEIEKNPKNIEGYFGLSITLGMQLLFPYLSRERIQVTTAQSLSLFQEAISLDPDLSFTPRFAPAFFIAGLMLHQETRTLLSTFHGRLTAQDRALKEMLLNQGASLTLHNNKEISTKELYHYALPFLSSASIKKMIDQEFGNYLSDRKPIVLQDGVKLTKLMAYAYAYSKASINGYFFMKIGDALHPVQQVLLGNKSYEKIDCYRRGAEKMERYPRSGVNDRLGHTSLRLAETLYLHEDSKKKELLCDALEKSSSSLDHLESHMLLARILSQYELQRVGSKYLLMFGKCLESHSHLDIQSAHHSLKRYYELLEYPYKYADLENIALDNEFYFTKKREFLLNLLTCLPACKEAYVALGTSFQAPLIIHEKSYPSKASLYLKAIDINPEYSLPYFLLGEELFHTKTANIQLLNGVTLSCKQLLMRAIQLGAYDAKAYHLAALAMDERDGVLLFDGETMLSRGDLFIQAFKLDPTRSIDLKNFIYHIKKSNKATV